MGAKRVETTAMAAEAAERDRKEKKISNACGEKQRDGLNMWA
jgi:hypothetical protein